MKWLHFWWWGSAHFKSCGFILIDLISILPLWIMSRSWVPHSYRMYYVPHYSHCIPLHMSTTGFMLLDYWGNLPMYSMVSRDIPWFFAYPSEKWWTSDQLGWWNSQLNVKIHVPNHQPVCIYIYVHHSSIIHIFHISVAYYSTTSHIYIYYHTMVSHLPH